MYLRKVNKKTTVKSRLLFSTLYTCTINYSSSSRISRTSRRAELHGVFCYTSRTCVKSDSVVVTVRVDSGCHRVYSSYVLCVYDRSGTASIRRDTSVARRAVVRCRCGTVRNEHVKNDKYVSKVTDKCQKLTNTSTL